MEDYFKELVEIVFAIERKDALLKQKTADLRRMALLAKKGKKNLKNLSSWMQSTDTQLL